MPPKKKKTPPSKLPIPVQLIERRIYLVRGKKVMIDTDLAELYGVPTYRLNEAVKRNRKRFPEDFMFQLATKEAESLTSQIAMSNKGRGGRRTLPYAFTGLCLQSEGPTCLHVQPKDFMGKMALG